MHAHRPLATIVCTQGSALSSKDVGKGVGMAHRSPLSPLETLRVQQLGESPGYLLWAGICMGGYLGSGYLGGPHPQPSAADTLGELGLQFTHLQDGAYKAATTKGD